jgi:hypothetical protein
LAWSCSEHSIRGSMRDSMPNDKNCSQRQVVLQFRSRFTSLGLAWRSSDR